MDGSWFDKLTMRERVGCKIIHHRCRIELPAILTLPHGELVEPRTTHYRDAERLMAGADRNRRSTTILNGAFPRLFS
ncbi:hypothetical protein FHW16_002414 [Phyllobacterium myrsinacearum]|uniref:Uncharacterized protein n=1 Tax=Phyllobacterium myrsinacearum TaxID=28101 RepID=A0A839EII6_9HYPH|nr:hypothetical protein [Phyllobacterium myrsinacearum]